MNNTPNTNTAPAVGAHTPGPWRFEQEREDRVSGTEAWGDCYAIHSVDANPVRELYVGFVLRCEDARLIAAAPELLAAAIRAERYMARLVRESTSPAGKELTELRALIAKAEGRA